MTPAEQWDAIVVGSGFGGAVAAARLAQAGQRVLILERGRRWARGSFPRSADLKDGWLWESGGGLYDIRWLDGMASAHAAGWGGGSLVYANVFARPPAGILGDEWPAELRREALDRYYDLAAHMLDVGPVPVEVPRTALLEDLARRMDRAHGTVRPNLAVRFGDDIDAPGRNRVGAEQWSCTFVGDCVAGCNQGAKSSMDRTYLALAEQAGAEGRADAEVQRISPTGDGRWAVTWGEDGSAEATTLILAAGTLGTTELLLRARDVDGTLPDLSPTLGTRFSGNGDALELASVRRRTRSLDLDRGPTITTTTVVDVDEARRPVWFQVQDGGIGPAVRRIIDRQLPWPRLRARLRGGRPPGPAMALLAMGTDTGTGTLHLDEHGRITLGWSNRDNRRLYRAQGRIGSPVGRLLGLRIAPSPTWSILRRAVTVHPLGGVPVGADATTGVIDAAEEVHGHPGLFVVDGSSLPGPTGTNPSATILATAEYRVERLIRRLTGDAGWQAPEWPDVVPTPVPEDAAAERMRRRRVTTHGDGVRFAEVMRDPRGASNVRLRVGTPGLDPFLADPHHALRVTGFVDLPGIASSRSVAGTLSLLPDDAPIAMRYDLAFTADDGRALTLVGVKRRDAGGLLGMWRAVTVLHVSLTDATGVPVEAPGAALVIGPVAAARLLTTLRGVGFTLPRRLRALARFGWFFTVRALRLRVVKD